MFTDTSAALGRTHDDAGDASATRFEPTMPSALLRRHQQLLHDLANLSRFRPGAPAPDLALQIRAFQADFDRYAVVVDAHLFRYLDLHTSADRAASAAVHAARALFESTVGHVAAFTQRCRDAGAGDEHRLANELNFLKSWLAASLRRVESVMLGYYRPESVLAATLRAARPTAVRTL